MSVEKTRIISHTFKGSDEFGYTYEITFNKSLQDTLRMDAMCKGLDDYDENITSMVKEQKLKDDMLYAWAEGTIQDCINVAQEHINSQTASLSKELEKLKRHLLFKDACELPEKDAEIEREKAKSAKLTDYLNKQLNLLKWKQENGSGYDDEIDELSHLLSEYEKKGGTNEV